MMPERRLAATTPASESAVELVPGKLYRLGGAAEIIDDNINWIPAGRTGFEPVNCYLVVEGRDALLVDTGVAAHAQLIVDQIQAILGPRPTLSILLTRAEPDCQGNLPSILAACDVPYVYVGATEQGGGVNPFNYFDRRVVDERPGGPTQLALRKPGETIDLGKRSLLLVRATLRVIHTLWVHDVATETLFSSDMFGHFGLASRQDEPVVRRGALPADSELARGFLLTKFEWLETAELGSIRSDIRALFDTLGISRIAPTHGCVLDGPAARQQLDVVLDVLAELGAARGEKGT